MSSRQILIRFEPLVFRSFATGHRQDARFQSIQLYVRNLTQALGVPGERDVRLEETAESSSQLGFQVVMDGAVCRAPFDLRHSSGEERDLAAEAAEIIRGNRELLLNPEDIPELLRNWEAGPRAVRLSQTSLLMLFRSLLRYGFSTNGVKDLVLQYRGEDTERTAADVLEAALARQNPHVELSVRGWPADNFPAIQSDMVRRLGIAFPIPEVRTRPAQPADSIQIHLNDLPLFPMPMGDDFPTRFGNILREHTPAFLNTTLLRVSTRHLQKTVPKLVESALQRFDLPALARILRFLLAEQVSIADLNTIFETLLAIRGAMPVHDFEHLLVPPRVGILLPVPAARSSEPLQAADYANGIRASMKGFFTRKYAIGEQLHALTTGETLEQHLLDSAPLDLPQRDALFQTISGQLKSLRSAWSGPPVLLTQPVVRQKLRDMICIEFPDIAVLSDEELLPCVRVISTAEIGLP